MEIISIRVFRCRKLPVPSDYGHTAVLFWRPTKAAMITGTESTRRLLAAHRPLLGRGTPANEVRFRSRTRIGVSDSTLRDGRAGAGCLLHAVRQKSAIAEVMERAGIDEIEAGNPADGGRRGRSNSAAIGQTIQEPVGWLRGGPREKPMRIVWAGAVVNHPAARAGVPEKSKD